MFLERKGMIRACHPPTPLVGLHRQSRDPKRTRIYYNQERMKRDLACFPRMLRQMTHRFQGYRLKRRLLIKAIQKILHGIGFVDYLTMNVLEYLSDTKSERIPLYFNPHLFKDSQSLHPYIRFTQLAGRLVTLGFPVRIMPDVNYERDACMFACELVDRDDALPMILALQQRNVPNIWRIVFSRFPRLYQTDDKHPIYSMKQWNSWLSNNKLIHLFKYFKWINELTQEEIDYMYEWIGRMNYPSS